MSWDVIYWDERKYVDYVPTCWGDGHRRYKFPRYCSKALLEELIAACDPLLNYKYKWHEAEVKKRNIKSLEEAKSVCRIAEESSTLEEGDISSSSSEDTLQQINDSEGEQDLEIVAPIKLTNDTLLDETQNYVANNGNGKNSSFSIETSTKKPNYHRISPSKKMPNTPISTPTRTNPVLTSTRTANNTPVSLASTVDGNVMLTAGELYISQKIAGIEFELKAFQKRFDELEKRLLASAVLPENFGVTSEILKMLPCASNQDLLKLNNIISDDDNQMNILVECLYLCGGETYHKAIFLQMRRIITKDVALLYSGEGKKGKLSFKNLKLYEAILRAVRKKFSTATEQDIKKSISSFLAGSKDQEGGRNKRRTPASEEHTN